MKVKVFVNSREVEYDLIKFSGGEVHVTLKDPPNVGHGQSAYFQANLLSSDDIMTLFVLTDAIRQFYGKRISCHLNITYLPYGRQDRCTHTGTAFSLSVFSTLLNAMKYESVMISDPHSEVALDTIDRSGAWSQHTEFYRADCQNFYKALSERWYILFPDKGAAKKAAGWKTHHLDFFEKYLFAEKTRDPSTGKLSDPTFLFKKEDLDPNVPILIVDDICDGGGTFIQLAKALRAEGFVNDLHLTVTHGIFSRGKDLPEFKSVRAVYDYTHFKENQ